MRRLALLTSTLCLTLGPAQAQEPAAAPDRDPEAMAALDKMGASMRRLRSFAVHADITSEEVLKSGQKLQFGGTVDMAVRRPDGLLATIQSDRTGRKFFYDGKTFTVVAPKLGYYAAFQAPPTLRETMRVAAEQYGIEVPLADLFSWGEDRDQVEAIRTAFRVGSDVVNGASCTHYAVRQPLVDWQIWINEAGDSLPCKLVITDRRDSAMPQYTAVYRWTRSMRFAGDHFRFAPPRGAYEIAIAAGAGKEGK